MTFTGSTSYNLNSFIPQDWRGWDDYLNRLSRYEVFEGYYHNIAYHAIVTYSQALKTTERLYKHVRGVYNPINRLVESYVSKVYGGVLDTQKGVAGSIPLDTDNKALTEAVIQLWRDSNWGQKKSLYVRNGAKLGDTYIKIVDDIQAQQVRMEVIDPSKVKTVKRNPDGSIAFVELEYYIRNEGKMALYCETITPDQFTTRIDGEITAIWQNGRGEPVAEWDNEYGFVPMVHVLHTDVGLAYGAPAAHGTLHKINELNDLASILNDGMRKQVNMPMVTIGGKVETVDYGTDRSGNAVNRADTPQKDTVNVLNIPNENATVLFPAPTISIADGLQNVINIESELEKDLPELALHRLRDGGNLTAPGVTSAFSDAIAKYQEARGNYDTGMVEAHKMAIAIGGMRGYKGYQGFNLMSIENGNLDHQISARPVINDTLSLKEQMELTLQAIAANVPKELYTKMGWSETVAQTLFSSTSRAKLREQQTAIRMQATPPPSQNGNVPNTRMQTVEPVTNFEDVPQK
jgi:hypothetical protein